MAKHKRLSPLIVPKRSIRWQSPTTVAMAKCAIWVRRGTDITSRTTADAKFAVLSVVAGPRRKRKVFDPPSVEQTGKALIALDAARLGVEPVLLLTLSGEPAEFIFAMRSFEAPLGAQRALRDCF
jgi:hypothetical protein